MLHFAWEYTSKTDRAVLLANVEQMRQYAELRRTASTKRNEVIGYLKSPRLHHAEIEPRLDPFRTWFMGSALLSFNFDYGDLVRWLDGEHTTNHRDFSDLVDAMDAVCNIPTRPGYPPVDYDIAARVLMEGAPLRGIYQCPKRDTYLRVQYDNHPPLRQAMDDVREKSTKRKHARST